MYQTPGRISTRPGVFSIMPELYRLLSQSHEKVILPERKLMRTFSTAIAIDPPLQNVWNTLADIGRIDA